MGISPSYARAGALIALSCDYRDIGNQAGEISVRILKGERCSAIKVAPPRKVKLFLNIAVADRLGVKIPKKILREAEEVFGQ
jgi:putative ABC transport system substrate-binding protein